MVIRATYSQFTSLSKMRFIVAPAKEFMISVWHGYELLNKLRSAKVVDGALVREIFEALEVNGDLPKSWRDAKHSVFWKIFGRKASSG